MFDGWTDTCREYGYFFFSSRRRHTRYIGDWSSDVCSSDLKLVGGNFVRKIRQGISQVPGNCSHRESVRVHRSEERRVGKECRSRWRRYHEKKKGRTAM